MDTYPSCSSQMNCSCLVAKAGTNGILNKYNTNWKSLIMYHFSFKGQTLQLIRVHTVGKSSNSPLVYEKVKVHLYKINLKYVHNVQNIGHTNYINIMNSNKTKKKKRNMHLFSDFSTQSLSKGVIMLVVK